MPGLEKVTALGRVSEDELSLRFTLKGFAPNLSVHPLGLRRRMVRIDPTPTASREVLPAGELFVWTAELPNQQHALALFNLGDQPAKISHNFSEFGLVEGHWMAENVWTGKRSKTAGKIDEEFKPHACILLVLTKK